METMMNAIDRLTDSQLKDVHANAAVQLISCLYGISDAGPRSLSNALDTAIAADNFRVKYPRHLYGDLLARRMEWLQKAAVNPGTTLEPAWAAPLAALRPFLSAFVDLARASSLIGKLLPAASQVPFNVSVPAASGGGTYRWVGQGHAAPVGNMQLSSATLPVSKVSGILVVTQELAKLSAPGSDVALRRELIRGTAEYLDAQFTDPTVAAVSGVSPASIANGAPSIASAGSSAANALTDIKNLISTFTATNPDAASMALLMSPGVATAMAVATNSQTLGPDGGRLFGVPVHTGKIGNRVVALDPSALLIADDGDMDISVSRQATVELDTAAASPVSASSVYVSLWNLGLVGLRVTRFINWKMARANAVLYTNVSYS